MAAQSLAERYRAHREAFTLALELGCTPREAEQEIALRKARAADEEAAKRLAEKMAAPLTPGLSEPIPEPPFEADRDPEPWMMRD